MATTQTLRVLSGSDDGGAIQIDAPSTPGKLIHTATPQDGDDDNADICILYATNTSGSNVILTLEHGGTGIGKNIKHNVPANGSIPLGEYTLKGGKTLAAFAGTINVINVWGHVLRSATS